MDRQGNVNNTGLVVRFIHSQIVVLPMKMRSENIRHISREILSELNNLLNELAKKNKESRFDQEL